MNSTDTAWTEKGTVWEQIDPKSLSQHETQNTNKKPRRKDIVKTNEDLTR